METRRKQTAGWLLGPIPAFCLSVVSCIVLPGLVTIYWYQSYFSFSPDSISQRSRTVAAVCLALAVLALALSLTAWRRIARADRPAGLAVAGVVLAGWGLAELAIMFILLYTNIVGASE